MHQVGAAREQPVDVVLREPGIRQGGACRFDVQLQRGGVWDLSEP
jgi:hypothetical protein